MFDSARITPSGREHILLSGEPDGAPLSFPALAVYCDCLVCYRSFRVLSLTSPDALLENYHKNAIIIDASGHVYRVVCASPRKRSLINSFFRVLRILVLVDLLVEDVTSEYNLDVIKANISDSIRRDPIRLEQEDAELTVEIVNKCNAVSEIVRYYCCGE